jgi:poly(A) polymerase
VETLFTAPGGAELAARTRALVQDDPTSILAIAAHIGRTGTPAPPSVTRACTEELALTEDIEPARLREAIESCLCDRDVDLALQWLYEIGFTRLHLPELDATKDLTQEGGRRHKDVWEHTKLVVKQAVPRPAVRWAALLHDIGKVPTRTFTNKGVHFHGHAEVGARMFDKIARRIAFDGPQRKKVRFLIKHHLRSNQYSDRWTDSAVRRFAREMDEHLADLLDLSRADITSKRPGRRQALLRQIHDLAERVERLRAEDAVVPPLRKGIGETIMQHFGLPPSKRIGDLKRALETAVERGELEPHRDDDYYIAWLEASDLVPRGDDADSANATDPPPAEAS